MNIKAYLENRMKSITIIQVELTDEQHDDKCLNCCLMSLGNCSTVQSWLVNHKGFKGCSSGYNYQEVEK